MRLDIDTSATIAGYMRSQRFSQWAALCGLGWTSPHRHRNEELYPDAGGWTPTGRPFHSTRTGVQVTTMVT
jgi:hypothetical protein